jgi:hypothetical protein
VGMQKGISLEWIVVGQAERDNYSDSGPSGSTHKLGPCTYYVKSQRAGTARVTRLFARSVPYFASVTIFFWKIKKILVLSFFLP